MTRARNTKRCPRCGETKPLDHFYLDRTKRNGHRGECGSCHRARERERYVPVLVRSAAARGQWDTSYAAIVEPDCVTMADRIDRPLPALIPQPSAPPSIIELLRVPIWWEQANCLGMDPDAFHPGVGGASAGGGVVAAARLVCQGCAVQDLCLERAIEIRALLGRDHDHGVWGGTTPQERGRIVAARRRSAA